MSIERSTPVQLTLSEVKMIDHALRAADHRLGWPRSGFEALKARFAELIPILEDLQPIERGARHE